MELTFGQKAVGLTFNPSGDEKVTKAKQLSADLIDLVENHHNENYIDAHGVTKSSWIINVFRTAAFNALIASQMAVVKYLTYKEN
jgi:hypothetical protein